MKNSLQWAFACACLFLTACSTLPPGWKEYRSAIKCDLQDKGGECDTLYASAIQANPALPGIYSSYGSHLYRLGDFAAADEYFRKEIKQNPEASQAIQIILNKKQAAAADSSH